MYGRLNAAARGYALRDRLAAWRPREGRSVVICWPFARRTVRLLKYIRRTLRMMGCLPETN